MSRFWERSREPAQAPRLTDERTGARTDGAHGPFAGSAGRRGEVPAERRSGSGELPIARPHAQGGERCAAAMFRHTCRAYAAHATPECRGAGNAGTPILKHIGVKVNSDRRLTAAGSPRVIHLASPRLRWGRYDGRSGRAGAFNQHPHIRSEDLHDCSRPHRFGEGRHDSVRRPRRTHRRREQERGTHRHQARLRRRSS